MSRGRDGLGPKCPVTTNTGNGSLYGLQKYGLKYGLSVHIKNKERFKSQLYMQNTIIFLNHKH